MRKDNLHDILGEGDGSIGEIAFYYFDQSRPEQKIDQCLATTYNSSQIHMKLSGSLGFLEDKREYIVE